MAVVVLVILGIAFALFVSGKLRPDLIAILVLVSLVLSGAIAPSDVFQGFSSNAVITVAGLMVIGQGLVRTGVVKWVAKRLERVIHGRYRRLLLLNMATPGLLSGFVNIVAAASFFIPVILRLSKNMKVSPSKILLPMAYTALIGANLTLIGASHNLVVHSLLVEENGKGFAFFEFTAVGAALLVAAMAYIFFVGQRLLPGAEETKDPTDAPVSANLIDAFELQDRLFEVWVGEREDGEPPTIAELGLEDRGLTLIAMVRDEKQIAFPGSDVLLRLDDTLLLSGRQEVVEALAGERSVLTFLGPPKGQAAYPISTAELAEAVVPPRSPAAGAPIRDLKLVESFDMVPIAYFRDGAPRRTDVLDTELEVGDSILVYGPRDKMRAFDPEKELLIYHRPGEPEVSAALARRGPLAVIILLAVIVVAAIGWFPIAVTAVAGAAAMVLMGMVRVEAVYQAIDWRTIVLIGGMYPLGSALTETGAADLVGEGLISALGGFGPIAVLAGIVVLSMMLTQAMHNAAVAVIVAPIAINAAKLLGSNPTGFCVGVVVACSAAFLLPFGHPAPLLVEEPGDYQRADYLKLGSGLCLLTVAVVVGIVPLLWPL